MTPIRPAQGALLPSISPRPADLTAANLALTTVRNLGLLGGPVVAALVLRDSTPAGVFVVCAVMAVGATVLIVAVPGDPPREIAGSAAADVLEGARLLFREERGALVVGVAFAKHVVMGAIRTFLVIVALGLGMCPGGPAALSVALGLGGALGAGTAVLLVGRRR